MPPPKVAAKATAPITIRLTFSDGFKTSLRLKCRRGLTLRPVCHHVGGRGGGAGHAHQYQSDLRGAFHVVIEAALMRPAVTDAAPSQIAGAISPFAMRCDRSGMGKRAR